jgi:arylamine N-acetyltransferase
MGYVLEELGFGVEGFAGRVVWMNPGRPLPAQTHQVLSVTVPGVDGPLLVDVADSTGGRPSTGTQPSSPPARSRGSISKSEVGMCQRGDG